MTKYSDEFEDLDWNWNDSMDCYVVRRNDANNILYRAENEIKELRETLEKILKIKDAPNYEPIVFKYNQIIKLVRETLEGLDNG